MSDCCEDLKRSLANLESALAANKNTIDGLKNRVNNLENQLNKAKQGNNQNSTMSALADRVARLESYCDSIEVVFLAIAKVLKPISRIFGK